VVFAIDNLGGPGTLALVSVLAAVGSLVLIIKTSRVRMVIHYCLLAGTLLSVVVFAVFSPEIIKTTKGKWLLLLSGASSGAQEIPQKHDFTQWGALTRVDVTPEMTLGPLLVMVGSKRKNEFYKLRIVLQDLSAFTPMYRFSGNFEELPFLPHSSQASAYFGKSDADVLVIGSGGGSGVMVALSLGARKVTAVEINPLTCRVVTREFSDYIGGLYFRPDVELINAEGRSYLARTQRKFDVIEMTFVDSFTALSSGAYSLSENYLYTVEAFEEILDHLKTDGVLSCSRFYFTPPRESLRIVAITIEALTRRGIKEPWRYFFILGTKDRVTILLKKNGFLPGEAAIIDRFCQVEGFRILYNPYRYIPNEFSVYAKSDERERREFQRDHIYDISPTTDDAPFFFQYYFKWSRLWKWLTGIEDFGYKFPVGHLIFLAGLIQVTIFSLLFIIWPLWRFVRKESTDPNSLPLGILVYFAALGTGYMAIEIVLMQKLMVFLGYPVRSLTVVLFSLLISSGLGSAVSRRWGDKTLKVVGFAVAIILLLIPLELLLIEKVFQHYFMAMSPPPRFILATVAIFPLGFVMGIPFPSGIRLIGNKYPNMIPWYWGVNACFSVISSLVTVLVSMTAGFRIAMIVAGIVYLVGYLGLRSGIRKL